MPPGVRDVRGRLQVPPSQQRIHITLGIPGTTSIINVNNCQRQQNNQIFFISGDSNNHLTALALADRKKRTKVFFKSRKKDINH